MVRLTIVLTAFLGSLTTDWTIGTAQARGTIDAVRERGYLSCGVNDIPGFAIMDTRGHWDGFNVAFCRAVAAAVLNNPEAVDFVSAFSRRRFEAIAGGDVDIVNANATWTLSREATWSLAIAAIIYYDGQGFIAHRELGIDGVKGLTDQSVCVVEGTTTEANLIDLTRRGGRFDFEIEQRTTLDGAWYGFVGRQCDLFSIDRTVLYVLRAFQTSNPADYIVLDDTVSREPLALMVRDDDQAWLRIVRWTAFALVVAEEHGITADAARANLPARDAEVRRLLGQQAGIGALLGLDDDWARRAIIAAGHYGELFDRTLGSDSPFDMTRGMNALWRDGGLIYAPPLR